MKKIELTDKEIEEVRQEFLRLGPEEFMRRYYTPEIRAKVKTAELELEAERWKKHHKPH